jgi:hypothetical protein
LSARVNVEFSIFFGHRWAVIAKRGRLRSEINAMASKHLKNNKKKCKNTQKQLKMTKNDSEMVTDGCM